MSMEKHCIAWSDVPEEVSASGVGKRTLAGLGVSLTMVRVPAGTEAPRHNHPHEQFVQVISGSGVLETEQGAFPFAAGSVFQFPRHEWHAARFDTDTVLVETNLPA
jgi:quercetin dioxygenase-like cupin family protein